MNLPTVLEKMSAGRGSISTNDLAFVLERSTQTIRKLICYQGHVYGLKPMKIGGRLRFNVADVAKLMMEGS